MKAVPFRNPNHKEEVEAKTLRPQFFLSSVFAMELFAGCRTKRQQSELESFLKPFEKAKRVIAPDHSSFLEAGRVLARLGAMGPQWSRCNHSQRPRFSLIEVHAHVRWMLPV